MTGILLATHGPLAAALLETAAMLVTELSKVEVLGFLPGQGPEDLEAAVRATLARLQPGPVLALVDLPGGTPARVLAQLALQHPPIEIVTGVNLPMLAEVLLSRNDALGSDPAAHLTALAAAAATAGTSGIVNVTALLRAEAPETAATSEGG